MGLLKAPRMAYSASLTMTGLAALHCSARVQASIKHSAWESSYSQGSTAFSFHFFKNQKQKKKKKNIYVEENVVICTVNIFTFVPTLL